MSAEYDQYIVEHKKNLMLGLQWMEQNLPHHMIDGEKMVEAMANAEIHDQSKYDKEEYDAYVENGEAQFIEGVNKKSKKVVIVKDDSSADYIMTIKFSNFDKFFSVMSLVPGNKHKIWGEIIVKDKKTGEVICTYIVKEFKGGRDFSIFDSFKESMLDLGSELAETK